jgi:hypothetical protein
MDPTTSEGPLRPAPQSLLGVDLGSAFTKASLFELVEGQYRLVARGRARTTAQSHVYEGLEDACKQIEALTGRVLFDGEPLAGEVSGGRGVEVLAVAVSCFDPLRVLAVSPDAAAAARAELCQVSTQNGSRLQDRVRQVSEGRWDAVLGSQADVEAVRPYLPPIGGPVVLTGDAATFRAELPILAVKTAYDQAAGLADLAAAATEPLTTSAAAILDLAQLVASRFGLRLAIADCGASQTTVAYATPDQAGARLAPHQRPLRDVPATAADMRALHQALQAGLAGCVAEGFTADLVVGTGMLAHFGQWAHPALTLLNGIQPAGVIQFALDAAGIISQVAVFAKSLPDVTCRIFEQDGLVGLGAAVCPRGAGKAGTKALQVRWRMDEEEEQQRDVAYGELVRIPLGPGHKASLALYPVKQVDVGLNRPGVAATAQIDGGRVGLMIDMRDPAAKADRAGWEMALG